jgi:hypothetical protein
MTKDEAFSTERALKLALEALTIQSDRVTEIGKKREAITAIKQALSDATHMAAPVPDIPDLIAGALGVSRGTAYDLMREALKEAAPVQEERKRQSAPDPKDRRSAWVGLTDEEIIKATENIAGRKNIARAIEAKLKEKNSD